MVTKKRYIGDIGEEIACTFLKKRGWKIVERNYLKKWGEIDIIATEKGILHFVEVKTVQNKVSRGTGEFDSPEVYLKGHDRYLTNVFKGHFKSQSNLPLEGFRPEENVHPKKIKRLHRAIETYVSERNVPRETEFQLDVVTVVLDLASKQAKVDILENIILG